MGRSAIVRWIAGVLAFCIVPCALGQRMMLAPDQHVSADQIQHAIDAARVYLYNQQHPDGSWEAAPMIVNGKPMPVMAPGQQIGGVSALATYALLTGGADPKDPAIASAINYLQGIDMKGVYALGLRCQVWNQIAMSLDPEDKSEITQQLRQRISHDGQLLMNAVKLQGAAVGMYTYITDDVDGGRYDHSCANYGAMGVWACAQAGMVVSPKYWQIVAAGWKSHQAADGSWNYIYAAPGNGMPQKGTPSMTAGALVNLFITQEYDEKNRDAQCKGNLIDPNIATAIKWLADNPTNWNNYTLFNIQRVGFESGYKWFEKLDWFQAGADDLVSKQQKDGSWQGGMGGPVAETAFALAFLSLGQAPVVFNKLQYGHDDAQTPKEKQTPWDERPRDIANVTRWLERHIHHHLNWQIVNLGMGMDVLHESPILYLSGNAALQFTPQELEILRQYILEGGMIVGNPDCDSKAFSDSFTKMGQEIFPEYLFRKLPANHPIFSAELFPFKGGANERAVMALGNQAREFMLLLSAGDPGKSWQQLPIAGQAPGGVQELDAHLAGDIFYYSTEQSKLRNKGVSYILKPDAQPDAAKKLSVAYLEYEGNWNPEPFGWQQMTVAMHNRHHIALDLQPVRLGIDPIDGKYPIAFLTGTEKVEFTDAQREALKRFGYEGGYLIVDCCGGSTDFADSMMRELKTIFQEDPALLTPDDSVFTIDYDLSKVKYRALAKRRMKTDVGYPLLHGIEHDKKALVFFSPLDLGVGMVGQNVDAVIGYEPASAQQIMMNMLIYFQKASSGKP